jgi:ABC-type iron transport system FetAB ATPase subunit
LTVLNTGAPSTADPGQAYSDASFEVTTPTQRTLHGFDAARPNAGPLGGLAKLAIRWYQPRAGHVLLDGTDVRDLPEPWLYDRPGLVPQKPFVFSGTVRDNVAFARPDARRAGGERRAIRRAARLASLIERLSLGAPGL